MYRPGGVRPPGGRPDHRRGRRVSTRSASTPPPLAGGGWEGATPGPQSALPPTSSRTGRGSIVPALLALLALLPSVCLALAATGALLDSPSRPTSPASPPSAPRSSTARTAPLALLPAPGGVWRFRSDTAPPLLTDLLIAVEDRRFWHHPGVDPLALVRAAAQLLRAGHVVSGGSTLAMQAARLLRAAPAHPALQADRDRPRPAARGALRPARRARHLADPGAVRRQPGGHPRRLARLVRRAARGAGTGAGRPAGRDPPPARAPAPGPPRRGATVVRDRVLAVGVRAGPVRRRTCAHARADRPRPAAPPRAATRGIAAATCRGSTPRWTCRCRLHWSAWDRSGWKPCRSAPRSRCWWPMHPRARSARSIAGAWRDQARAGAHRPDQRRALPRIGAEAVHLRHGLRRRHRRAGHGGARPAAPLRRLRAGELRPRLRRQHHGGRRAAPLAEPAGRGAARPRRPAALRRHAPRRRRRRSVCRAAPTRRCRWRSAATASRCAMRPRCTPRWPPTAPAARCACSPDQPPHVQTSWPPAPRARWPMC